jgi:hypothetical protein
MIEPGIQVRMPKTMRGTGSAKTTTICRFSRAKGRPGGRPCCFSRGRSAPAYATRGRRGRPREAAAAASGAHVPGSLHHRPVAVAAQRLSAQRERVKRAQATGGPVHLWAVCRSKNVIGPVCSK